MARAVALALVAAALSLTAVGLSALDLRKASGATLGLAVSAAVASVALVFVRQRNLVTRAAAHSPFD